MKRLILALLLIPSIVYAESWQFLWKNREGVYIYYDKDSIHHPEKRIEQGFLGSKKAVINKDIIGVWLKFGDKDPSLVKIYCSTRKWQSEGDLHYDPIPPGTGLESLHSIVCK